MASEGKEEEITEVPNEEDLQKAYLECMRQALVPFDDKEKDDGIKWVLKRHIIPSTPNFDNISNVIIDAIPEDNDAFPFKLVFTGNIVVHKEEGKEPVAPCSCSHTQYHMLPCCAVKFTLQPKVDRVLAKQRLKELMEMLPLNGLSHIRVFFASEESTDTIDVAK